MTKEPKSTALPAMCMALQNDILGDGDFLGTGTAASYITNYLEGIKDPTGSGHNFGYVFGLAKIYTFMMKIADYNASLPVDKQIHGIRLYLGRKNPLTTNPIPAEMVMDSPFLMPVMADGTDFYKMPPLADPGIILGNPRPCPNECLMLSFV